MKYTLGRQVIVEFIDKKRIPHSSLRKIVKIQKPYFWVNGFEIKFNLKTGFGENITQYCYPISDEDFQQMRYTQSELGYREIINPARLLRC